MRKQTIEYTSPIDALVAVAKRLSVHESQRQMDSETFFDPLDFIARLAALVPVKITEPLENTE